MRHVIELLGAAGCVAVCSACENPWQRDFAGGAGTHEEMLLLIALMEAGTVPPRPVVLLGDFWRQTAHPRIIGVTRAELQRYWHTVQRPQQVAAVLQMCNRP